MKLLERSEKYFFNEEFLAEEFIEKEKETKGQLVDWKISIKETRDSTYVIVTTKKKFLTLTEAKED